MHLLRSFCLDAKRTKKIKVREGLRTCQRKEPLLLAGAVFSFPRSPCELTHMSTLLKENKAPLRTALRAVTVLPAFADQYTN